MNRSAVVTGFLVLSLLLVACEGYRSAYGFVKDKTTGKPLDSVTCFVPTASRTVYTDTTGWFEVSNGMAGCTPECKDIIVRFSKTGYKPMEVTNPADTVFFLERQ